jgi:iron(III) transport system permease protein
VHGAGTVTGTKAARRAGWLSPKRWLSPTRRSAGRRTPVALLVLGAAVVAGLMLPLAFLVLQAAQAGGGELSRLLFRQLTLTLLWNTVKLVVVVTAACAVIGTATAWVTERSSLPGRRVVAALLVLPVAVPDFVIAWGWASLFPSLSGLAGAALVLTLGLYPLVYLPVAASFRRADAAQEYVARSLGRGPWRTFLSVTLPQARLAVTGGCLLVALYLLAEYGAFSVLRYQTFTTEIFAEFQQGFDAPAAAALSLVVVALGIVLLVGEAAATRPGRAALGRPRPQAGVLVVLGRATAPVVAGVGALVALAVGVPAAMILYWAASGQRTTLPAASSLAGAAWHTALYSGSAAAMATVAALPVAVLAVRHRRWPIVVMERAGLLVEALPGLVVALALVFFAARYAPLAYQSGPLLVVAYGIMFFPLALVAVRASMARVPTELEAVGRSLGRHPLSVALRVTLPLLMPGLLASFLLVFMTAATELPATLVLVPTGVQTLATQFWAYTGDFSYRAAAPFAAAMLVVAVVPSYLLGRWFDRLPSGAVGR